MSFRTDKTRGAHPITPKKGIKEVDLSIKEKGLNDRITVSVKPTNKEKLRVVVPPLKNTTVKGGVWDLKYSAGDSTEKSLEPLLEQMIKNYERYIQQNDSSSRNYHIYKDRLQELKTMKGHLTEKPNNPNFDTNMDLLVHLMRLDYFDYMSEKGVPSKQIMAILDGKIPPPKEENSKNRQSIKNGDIVAWKDPFADGKDERSWRFVVLEDKGDRVLIQPINNIEGLSIVPTQTVSKTHLINANQDSPELAKSHGD